MARAYRTILAATVTLGSIFWTSSGRSEGDFDPLNAGFPATPAPVLTPGSACANPDSYRYRERIPYCERAVPSSLKREIVRTYDQRLGFNIEQMDRTEFKIDHFIPLCAGGSNDRSNLWPQHRSIYVVTDSLEQLICEKMAEGRLQQRRAIAYIKAAKSDLAEAEAIFREVEDL